MTAPALAPQAPTLGGRLAAHRAILTALMLRDVRTRMGSAPAFLLVMLWPLAHILLLVILHSAVGHLPPYGDSMPIWVATGVLPYICYSYVSRYMMLSILTNKPLLSFPIITPMHVSLARFFLELLNSSQVIIFIYVLFYIVDMKLDPYNLPGVAAGLLTSIAFGAGVGFLVSALAGILRFMVTIYMLTLVMMWLTCGVYFLPAAMPKAVIAFLRYHPLAQCIEWVRASYYGGYQSVILDRGYAVSWAIGTLFVGLATERLLRGKILAH